MNHEFVFSCPIIAQRSLSWTQAAMSRLSLTVIYYNWVQVRYNVEIWHTDGADSVCYYGLC